MLVFSWPYVGWKCTFRKLVVIAYVARFVQHEFTLRF
jgi:hypothetical protein